MNDIEKLKLIRAKCVDLLAIAEKRTPGEWNIHAQFNGDALPVEMEDGSAFITWERKIAKGEMIIGEVTAYSDGGKGFPRVSTKAENEANAAFIASAAGPFEAALDSTIAAIDLCIANLHIDPTLGLEGEICDNDGRGCRACEYTELMQRNIIKAWEGLL